MEQSVSKEGLSEIKGKGGIFYLACGWIAALASLFRYPFVFGVAAVILAVLSSKKGSRAGLTLIVACFLCMTLGLIFNDIFFQYLKKALGV